MQDLVSYYQKEEEVALEQIKSLKLRLNRIVLLRVIVFLAICISIYLFFNQFIFLIPSIIIGAIVFGYLVKRNVLLSEQRAYWEAIANYFGNELKAQNGDTSFANNGLSYKPDNHDFANDIDLFGDNSFFQRVNKTSLNGGEQKLAEAFLANNNADVLSKQKTSAELSNKPKFVKSFIGFARIHQSDLTARVITDWFTNYKYILPTKIYLLLIPFGLLSIVFTIGLALGLVPGIYYSVWLIVGLTIIGIWLKKITKFNSEINRIAKNIKSYGDLLALIEQESFECEYLKKLQFTIMTGDEKASTAIAKFSRRIDLFNNRNNLLIGFFGNALLLWDLFTVFRLESWLREHKSVVQNWLEVIYDFDANISLATYSFNHPNYIFPELNEAVGSSVIEAHKLGHPLIKNEVCIRNSVSIDHRNFFIITGANMAGKSTFLRTVSLAILQTNLGLPVFAEEFKITPQKLITSMRTSDSLLDDESYFFAELKRLKHIIETIENDPYFIVLDEILKGTNSKDKEEGSKEFVRKLLRMNATGIIATHDLGLCTIEQENNLVSNYYFDAEIVNDELVFDYKMKGGICKNMNASFLLKKMEII